MASLHTSVIEFSWKLDFLGVLIVSFVVRNLSRHFNGDRVPSTIFSCRQIQIRENISLEPLKIFMHYKVKVIAGCVTCYAMKSAGSAALIKKDSEVQS